MSDWYMASPAVDRKSEVACQIHAGSLHTGQYLAQARLLRLRKSQQFPCTGLGVGGRPDQRCRFIEQFLVFRVDHQRSDAQFLQAVRRVLQLQRQDDQVRLQRRAAFQVKFLGSTHAGSSSRAGALS